MADRSDRFFLGKKYDLKQHKLLDEWIHYDPDDLTTHAVITGMTGSGKTGLGVILLEEAALMGIPAILIDPKGDLTNHLLHFPNLTPEDFKPWVDRDKARREGKTIEEAAVETASLWKNGLQSYGIGKTELETLRDAVDYAVYTPGSDAGLPVSILASLSAPPIPWEDNKEILREKITSTVTAILGLVGLKDIDPVRAKEHILLANIFEEAWSHGRDLDMATLINHVQSPPFDKLGVFSISQFYPENERYDLAMLLNNFLAAPSFQTWLEGQPLEIGKLLYTVDGKPRHSVFYLAHLNDEERMFFVTLLYTAIESWMREQKGASGLRALVYFDEITGYLPPVKNPPSKNIILRLLKQARAFGVGLMLATQNPVDLDYKALSNAGTWVIGKLQTEQDKARLLDGLEGAAPGVDRGAFDRMISLLDKRVFLLHNVHEDEPQVFYTRWAMNYLAGPITRAQIPALNDLVGAEVSSRQDEEPSETRKSTKEKRETTPWQEHAPAIPGSISVHYLPIKLPPSEALQAANKSLPTNAPEPKFLYRPALVGQARVAFLARKYNISHEAVYTVLVEELARKGLVHWENYLVAPLKLSTLDRAPVPDSLFDSLDTLPVADSSFMSDLKKDFEDWIYRTQVMTLRINPDVDVIAGPDSTEEEFHALCEKAVEQKRAEEIEAVREKYDKKLDTLEDKIKKEHLELAEDKQEFEHRRMEEIGKGVENVLSLFTGRRKSITTSLTKRRMTSKAKADIEESEQEIERLEKQMKALGADLEKELDEVTERWEGVLDQAVEEPVSPYKKNIFVEMFGVLWLPYYAFAGESDWLTIPAFKLEKNE